MKIYEDITHPVRGSDFFRKGKDRARRRGPTTLMKLATTMRQLYYGVGAHVCEEMTSCPKDIARKSLEEFCKWVERRYEGEFLGMWKEDLFLRKLEKNKETKISKLI